VDVFPAEAEAEDRRPWEQLVFVESENGQCTFVRLQMATAAD
jgi:hypothetical protein